MSYTTGRGSTFCDLWTRQLTQHFFCVGENVIMLWLGCQVLVGKTGFTGWSGVDGWAVKDKRDILHFKYFIFCR
jgi:hypothetical protein